MKNLLTIRCFKVALLTLTFLRFTGLYAQNGSQGVSDPFDFIPGMAVGKGFDFYQAKSMLKSALNSTQFIRSPYNGQTSNAEIKFIYDYSSLDDAFELNSDVSCNFLVASASAKFYFYDKVHFERNSLYFLIKSEITNSWDQLKEDPKFNNEALSILKTANGLYDFERIYGNTFVYGIQSGAAYYGLLTIEASNKENYEKIKTEFQGRVLVVSTSIGTTLENYSKEKKINMSLEEKVTGGVGLGVPSKNINEMFAKAKLLASQASTNPVPLKAMVGWYDEAGVEYKQQEIGLERELALMRLNYDYMDYLNLRKTFNYITQHPEYYRFKPNDQATKVNELKNRIKDINDNLKKLDYARKDLADLSKPISPSKIESPQAFASKILVPVIYEAPVSPSQLNVNFTPSAEKLYPLMHLTAGDDEMGGHSPTIDLYARIDLLPKDLPTKANLTFFCKMKESQSDWTTFEDSVTQQKLLQKDIDFPGGLIIKKIDPGYGKLHAQAGEDDHAFHTYNGSGLLKNALCQSDTPDGGEAFYIGCSKITFAPVAVSYQHVEDAKKLPITYKPASDLPVPVFIHKVEPQKVFKMKQHNLNNLQFNMMHKN